MLVAIGFLLLIVSMVVPLVRHGGAVGAILLAALAVSLIHVGVKHPPASTVPDQGDVALSIRETREATDYSLDRAWMATQTPAAGER